MCLWLALKTLKKSQIKLLWDHLLDVRCEIFCKLFGFQQRFKKIEFEKSTIGYCIDIDGGFFLALRVHVWFPSICLQCNKNVPRGNLFYHVLRYTNITAVVSRKKRSGCDTIVMAKTFAKPTVFQMNKAL